MDPIVYLIVLRKKEILLVKLRAPCLTETQGSREMSLNVTLFFGSAHYILLPLCELNQANQLGLFIPWIRVCSLSMEGILTKTAKTFAGWTIYFW